MNNSKLNPHETASRRCQPCSQSSWLAKYLVWSNKGTKKVHTYPSESLPPNNRAQNLKMSTFKIVAKEASKQKLHVICIRKSTTHWERECYAKHDKPISGRKILLLNRKKNSVKGMFSTYHSFICTKTTTSLIPFILENVNQAAFMLQIHPRKLWSGIVQEKLQLWFLQIAFLFFSCFCQNAIFALQEHLVPVVLLFSCMFGMRGF